MTVRASVDRLRMTWRGIPAITTSEETITVSTTPGRQIFDQHMAYLYARDLEGLLRNQYTPDAVLISPFDILDVPPPHIVYAGPKMIEFFSKWLDYHGEMTLDSLYDFAELDDSISFQAIITSQTGKWVLGEAWHFVGDEKKIDRHYGFAHKIG
jgi:hypothetical protein